MSYRQWLAQAKIRATALELEATAVEWLLLDLLGWTRVKLLSDGNQVMIEADAKRLDEGLARFLAGEPVQYITQQATFYGRDYYVDHRVLIPRPETEEVVLQFLKLCPSTGVIADVGTGSGVIALTIKQECPALEVWASDISLDALAVSRRNAQQLNVSINLIQGDVLAPFIERGIQLDGLISNPPYIAQTEMSEMGSDVIAHEPHLALFADQAGYGIYDQLLKGLPKVMKQGAPVVFEIGYQQGEALINMTKACYPHLHPQVLKDINGQPRVFYMIWNEAS
ncbi:peptide chain release factor N(5)-glutamine methyltransferase [Staphylococcus americanisciuri]|uniref:Release factor glutamine methyltransferase n=1 Tax=Staphylococcus americanisciuri TaxID=2973940 RepID=A0ABT2F3Q1_9STAP|nr:peptide chain release factor N(5)-glutamine methyltransferase [Staphylococcus americanisciuri]MCS4487022.1 peptide chain release factor N(5)-glutamine methyltransferase [Staphylococcus americanisciuri]